jgi:hypothetical protein
MWLDRTLLVSICDSGGANTRRVRQGGDYEARTVTLEFPSGKPATIKVKPDVPLQNAKMGEKVVYVSRTGLKLQVD